MLSTRRDRLVVVGILIRAFRDLATAEKDMQEERDYPLHGANKQPGNVLRGGRHHAAELRRCRAESIEGSNQQVD